MARSTQARRRARGEHRLRELLVSRRLLDHIEPAVLSPGEFDGLVDRIAAREIDPYTSRAAAGCSLTARLRLAPLKRGSGPRAGQAVS